MLASELFSFLKVKKVVGDIENLNIEHLSQSDRDIEANTVFFCIKGSQVDGHKFVGSAKEKGAALFVASEDISDAAGATPIVYVKDTLKTMGHLASVFYGLPSEKLYMVGITGTNGKTTIAYLMHHIFAKNGKFAGIMGTNGNRIGEEVFRTVNTTPDSLTLQGFLGHMVDAGCDSCIMEVSSHALVMDRVLGCNFDCAIFTNLTHEHLELHKTMEGYAHAKQRLFLEQGHSLKNGKFKTAVINLDDKYGKEFVENVVSELITYSIKDETADFRAKDIKYSAEGTEFVLVFGANEYDVKTNLIGEFNVYNSLAAIAGAFAHDIAVEDSITAISTFEGVPGRMQRIETGKPYDVVLDFAHTPDGLEKALDALKSIPHCGLITVIGHEGTNRDPGIRPELGKIALENSKWVVFTADNPRYETVSDISKAMVADSGKTNYFVVDDRGEAILKAMQLAEAGDIVLLAGKGVGTYQEIEGKYYPYSEMEAVQNALRKLS